MVTPRTTLPSRKHILQFSPLHYVSCDSRNKQWLVFITETDYVLCEVGTEFLYVIWKDVSPQTAVIILINNTFQTNMYFLFTPAVGPTQPPVQWVPLALCPGVKRPGREAESSPQVWIDPRATVRPEGLNQWKF
jgi:hypothetical protein